MTIRCWRRIRLKEIKMRAEIHTFEEYKALTPRIQKQISDGWIGEHLSQAEIVERRGRDVKVFRADYKYLSSHIHSDPYSLMVIFRMVKPED